MVEVGHRERTTLAAVETESNLEIVRALGIAESIVKLPGELARYRTWMGIGLGDKLYTDEMLLEYMQWGARNTKGLLLVVADFLRGYHTVAARGTWDALYHGKDAQQTARQGTQRRQELMELAADHGLNNISVMTWSEIFMELLQRTPKQEQATLSAEQRFFDSYNSPEDPFHERLVQITRQQIPDVINRLVASRGQDRAFVEQALTGYSFHEVFLTWLLARRGKFRIKIGHEGEFPYDQLTMDIFAGHFAALAPKQVNTFGAIHLRKK